MSAVQDMRCMCIVPQQADGHWLPVLKVLMVSCRMQKAECGCVEIMDMVILTDNQIL